MARIDYFNDPNAPKPNSIVPSVTAIVRNERGELLLMHKTDNDLWALPGDGMDVGESMSDTVIREVKEETGIDVEVTGVVGIYTNPNHVMAYDDGEVRQQCSICFTTRARWSARHHQRDQRSRVRCSDAAGQPEHPSPMLLRSTTFWSSVARPISAEPTRHPTDPGFDRSPNGGAVGPERWPGAPGRQADSGVAPPRSARPTSWADQMAR